MTIREAMRTHLMAQAPVSVLVGGRIYPLRLPQSAVMPALTLQQISARRLISHSGMNALRPGTRMQVDCWDKTPDGAEDVSEVVEDAVGAYRGMWGTVPIGASLLDDERDDFDVSSGLYRRIMEVLITYDGRAVGSISAPDPVTSIDANYIHTQSVAATVWTVTHNLGKYPAVTVVDSGDNELLADVHHLDLNTLTVTFAAASGGRVFVN